MAKKTRQEFFDPAADFNSRGYRKNFKTSGEPDEELMQDHVDSVVHFAEDDDRAKQSTGGEDNKDLVGHVQIATDAEAKANTDGLEATTTKVTHPGQLPTVEADAEAQVIDGSFQADFDDTPIEVSVDGGVGTRNNFLIKLKQSLLDFISGITNQIQTNITDISTNATNIATNATNIATNATNIANNTNTINSVQGGTLDVRKNNVTIEDPVNEMNFDGSDFNVQSFAPGQVVITAIPQSASSTVTSPSVAASLSIYEDLSVNDSNASITATNGTLRFQKIGRIATFSYSIGVTMSYTGVNTLFESTYVGIVFKLLLPERKASGGTYSGAATRINDRFEDPVAAVDNYITDGTVDGGANARDYLLFASAIDVGIVNGSKTFKFRGQITYQTES